MLTAKEVIYQKLARRAVEALKKRNIRAHFVADRSEALSAILGMIPDKASVGIGDSITMEQIGILDKLEERGGTRFSTLFAFCRTGVLRILPRCACSSCARLFYPMFFLRAATP